MKHHLVYYRRPDGQRKPAIVAVGRKHTYIIMQEGKLQVRKIKMDELDHMHELPDYTMARAVRLFRSYGKAHGTTEAAEKMLKRARKEEA